MSISKRKNNIKPIIEYNPYRIHMNLKDGIFSHISKNIDHKLWTIKDIENAAFNCAIHLWNAQHAKK